jgi:ribosomal protein S18 acetylase RimI-like enzyme
VTSSDRAAGQRAQTDVSTSPVTLRPADPSDIPDLASIFVRAFRAGYADLLPADVLDATRTPAVTAQFRAWPEGRETWVAVAGGAVGFARFGGAHDDSPGGADPTSGYLASLYVDPSAGGRGVGRLLLTHALDRMRIAGYRDVTLWVFRDNAAARGLYQSAGFAPDGSELVDPRWRVPQIGLRRPAAR